jgi:hypothetical protein
MFGFSNVAFATESGRAQALFDEGKALLTAGQTDEACTKLEASRALEAAPGTLFVLGTCYERQGKLASARAAYLDSSGMAAGASKDITLRAKAKAADLERRVPKLRILVAKAAGSDLVVWHGATRVTNVEWGTYLPVDPGLHLVRAEQPGFLPFERKVDVVEGTQQDVEIGPLVAKPTPAKAPDSLPKKSPAPTSPTPTSPRSPLGPVGLTLGAVGIAGLGLAGLSAIVANDAWRSPFGAGDCQKTSGRILCNSTGRDSVNAANTWATVATVAGIGGASLLAGGFLMWLLAPSGRAPTTAASPRINLAFDGTTLFARGDF